MKKLLALAAFVVIVHRLTNGQYGYHRDELATLDDARHLAWGYIAYPPFTPFVGRMAWELFGESLAGLRFFAVLAQAIAIVLAGLMARELGADRSAQLMAGAAVATAPVSIVAGELFQYVTFDYLWWVLAVYFLIRLLKSDDPRWWLGIGAAIGFGGMTKYTIGVLAIAMAAGLALTPSRRHLFSRWLLVAIAIAAIIVAPNLIWQLRHSLISLDFLRSIHARDVRIGRAGGFVPNQLFIPANTMTIPLWIAGLYFYFFAETGRRYRPIGWIFVVVFLFFLVARGRDYYMGPAYPMLLAAGAVQFQSFARWARRVEWGLIGVGGALVALLLPIAPVNSVLWNTVHSRIYDFREEVGWPDLVDTVAKVRDSLPPDERARAGIFASNYGEAGAIDLYGPTRGLPPVISAANSYWLRTYPEAQPQTLIVVGASRKASDKYMESCELAGQITNGYGVKNEESTDHADIFICRKPRLPWPQIWKEIRSFQ